MSICVEQSATLTNAATSEPKDSKNNTECSEQIPVQKTLTKLILTPSTAAGNSTSIIQKVPSTSVITVVNATGPLTILKSLCSNTSGTTAPHFTLVNSTPLNVTNAAGKPITVMGAPPITVVRAITNATSTTITEATNAGENAPSGGGYLVTSNLNGTLPDHNVFVKGASDPGVENGQKVAATNNNVIQSIVTKNGQKPVTTNNKLKIISNVVMPTANTAILGTNAVAINQNVLMSKPVTPSKFVQQPKFFKAPQNGTQQQQQQKFVGSQKIVYSNHKNPALRTLPPVTTTSSSVQQKPGIKTIPPQSKIPHPIQRSGSGLRTIPPQRPKISNRPNYIGKHAIQGQKFKSPHTKLKSIKPPTPSPSSVFPHRQPPQNTGVIYHQALTQNILQSLSENNTYSSCSPRFEPENYPEPSYVPLPPLPKPKSNLEVLSIICHAVLLDHNYTAKLPEETSPRSASTATTSPQLNGSPVAPYFPPPPNIRSRSLSNSSVTLSSFTNVTTNSIVPSSSNSSAVNLHDDDDNASDVSYGSDRKNETEGEETDTAPEAEAVNNDDTYDHYGDYVTRCICGFLHDDGYMIECDKCKVWQHVRCVIKSNKKVPDDYLCEVCDPSKHVDRGKARTSQQQWMRENQEREAKLRKEAKLKDVKQKENISDTDSSDDEAANRSRGNLAQRRKSDQRQNVRQKREVGRNESTMRRPVKRKEKKPTKKKMKPQPKSQSEDESMDAWSNPSLLQMPQLRQWIENYEEAVTNHYSPELRARISNIRINGAHSDLLSEVDTTVHKCRIHTQPLTGLKYLVSTMSLCADTPVVELRGKYMLSTQHRNNPSGHGSSLTTRQHSQRPGPFLFFYRLLRDNTEVCVDTRTYGNDARFIRRSCKPNAELRHCIEKGVLHLYIVTTTAVEKNLELTIKHESHDVASAGTTHIACACGKYDECALNKNGDRKKNGENSEITTVRKRRGRRAISTTSDHETLSNPSKVKEEPPDEIESKKELPEVKLETDLKQDSDKIKVEIDNDSGNTTEYRSTPEKEVVKDDRNTPPFPAQQQMLTRKSHQIKGEHEEKKEGFVKGSNGAEKSSGRKLSREERKLEAIVKAFERLEKQAQRKQEHQAKQAHRRESEPNPIHKEDDKIDFKLKRKRRKGRSRAASTNTQLRRNRLNSADSSYVTSGDEGSLMSPGEGNISHHNRHLLHDTNKDAGLLLALADGENLPHDLKSPVREVDCNSNSAHSSPETPLSSACLLVAAAVEPLEPSFKFPKTKKVLMNEWLNKSPDCIQSASSISPSSLTPHLNTNSDMFYDGANSAGLFGSNKGLVTLSQAANYCELPSQPHGNAKKRWLRQAISEDQCDSPNSRPESPPTLPENIAPPKKRRLPRESLSNEPSPPTTPTAIMKEEPEIKQQSGEEERVEIVYNVTEEETVNQEEVLESEEVLKERAIEMQQEFAGNVEVTESKTTPQKETGRNSKVDPRLARNSENLVGSAEKSLNLFGSEEKSAIGDNLPVKRKLSITEYRQRKKFTVEKTTLDEPLLEENTCSQSPPPSMRPRSNSASSVASYASSDEEMLPVDPPGKALSAFNSEPTELEKQRENAAIRLKKALGLSVDQDQPKTVLNFESLINCTIEPPTKTSLPSPTFPIPGSSEPPAPLVRPSKSSPEPEEPEQEPNETVKQEEENVDMFYNSDERTQEESAEVQHEDEEEEEVADEYQAEESADYVPPFNNPLYPNSSFVGFGSVIDDAPYEGRNPSPPPELSVTSSLRM